MSRSCNFYLSALLVSTFMSPAAAMDATLALPENDFTLEYIHANTPIPKPASLSNSYKTAAICFLGHGECDPSVGFGSGGNYKIDADEECQRLGFYVGSCNEAQVPTGYCPYNGSYIKGCKCASNLIDCPAGQVGDSTACEGRYLACKCDPNLVECDEDKEDGKGAFCGGKYERCECKSRYYYDSSKCSSPQVLTGDSCDGKYTGCACPSGVKENGYDCKTFYDYPCEGVCKERYEDGCHKYSESKDVGDTQYGCMETFHDCPSKCKTPYLNNCHNTTPVNCSQGCASKHEGCPDECAKCIVTTCNTEKSAVENILTSGTEVIINGKEIYNYASPANGATKCFRGLATTALAMMGLHGWDCTPCQAQSEDGTLTDGYNCTCVAATTYPNYTKKTGGAGGIDTLCGGVTIVCPNSKCKSGYTYSGGGCVENTCGSEYNLASCPTGGSCSNCKSGSTTKYKLDSCGSGYYQDGDGCYGCKTTTSCPLSPDQWEAQIPACNRKLLEIDDKCGGKVQCYIAGDNPNCSDSGSSKPDSCPASVKTWNYYYVTKPCSYWSSYTTAQACSTAQGTLAQRSDCSKKLASTGSESCVVRCSTTGNDRDACMSSCLGECDVDGFKACCLYCNGGLS